MKILVFGGSGKIGSAIAWDLVKEEDVEAVGIIGRRRDALEKTKAWISNPKVKSYNLDIADTQPIMGLMESYDVGVIALPDRRTSYCVLEMAINANLNIVDILEEYHRRPDPYENEDLDIPSGMLATDYGEWLHEKAQTRGLTILDGMGFAPGISNITLGEGIRKLDKAESAIARVGGIPAKDIAHTHPLKYMITWRLEHVLREYMVRVKVIKNGKIVEVDATSDLEPFRFTQFDIDEAFECAITPGMPSFIYTHPELLEFAEKTIRWPGHWQGVQTLKECGLLDLLPIEMNSLKIVPRDLLLAVLTPKLRPRGGETDVCAMWNTITGTKNGRRTVINYYLWDEADKNNRISAMARVTGYSAAVGALFLGRGMLTQKGIVPPEDGIQGEIYSLFMDELSKRAIRVINHIDVYESDGNTSSM